MIDIGIGGCKERGDPQSEGSNEVACGVVDEENISINGNSNNMEEERNDIPNERQEIYDR